MKVNTTNINLGTAYNINIPMKKKKNEDKSVFISVFDINLPKINIDA